MKLMKLSSSPRSCSKNIAQDQKKTWDVCAKVVNLFRSCSVNHRLFQSFCEEVGQEHTVLLYHTEVRLLSRGVVCDPVCLN